MNRANSLKQKQRLISLRALPILLMSLVTSLVLATPVFAQPQEWTGYCVSGPDNDVATIQGLECMIANIFVVIITVIGLAGFVMLIFGSLKWLVSGGNSQHTESARKTMTFAVVGLVVALSAFIILRLLASFTGIPGLTQFHIPTSDMVY